MRKMIAAFRVSLDGFVEGPEGANDWVASWEDTFDLMPRIDTMVLGGGMYPTYEEYWTAIEAAPDAPRPFDRKPATPGEVAYARFAVATPHVVVSTTLEAVAWPTTRIVRGVEAIRALKAAPGRDIYAVGGARLVGSLMEHGLVDELRLDVHPVVLGGGKALFGDVAERRSLELLDATRRGSGEARLAYAVR